MNMFSQLRIQTMQKNIKVPLTILNSKSVPRSNLYKNFSVNFQDFFSRYLHKYESSLKVLFCFMSFPLKIQKYTYLSTNSLITLSSLPM